MYALEAGTGALRWSKKIEEHRNATVTGTPADLGKQLDDDYTRVGKLLVDLKIKK